MKLSELSGTWVLYSGDEVPAGGFRCPTYEELQALPRYASFSEASAAWRALPRWKKNLTVILLKEKLEERAAKKSALLAGRVDEIVAERACSRGWAAHLAAREALGEPVGKRGRKPVYDKERLAQIMTERKCGRVTAYQVLKREMAGETPAEQAT